MRKYRCLRARNPSSESCRCRPMRTSTATSSAVGSCRRSTPRAACSPRATVAVNSFQFKQPVFIGDVLSFYGEIVRVGTTSITVNVEVYAQRNPTDLETVKVTEATLTYVATGPDRRPRPVPPLPDQKR